MNTQAPTLDDFPAELRDPIAAFAAGFVASIDSREQITPEAVANALTREAQRVTRLALDPRHPGRDALFGALAGTYDQFRAG